ncbi:hypothetical protein NG895_27250 [Aeoliella sp. ICT_H6.2]|uniref:Uncharacterized protein n=1 Tax=Aeoliella straminimaris TaxID=2954799 RepID=A0A9X2FF75_9BACT|nr:hypothetical protein [Aeoliella straminimaris]MCO6047619.1 hypothetical protein [Aeoliella straminimaris]
MRPFIAITALIIAGTGITPFELAGLDIGVDHAAQMTLTLMIFVALFFTMK